MFAGIVEEAGAVESFEIEAESKRLVIKSTLDHSDTKLGDSIAVNGVCLTVVAIDGGSRTYDGTAVEPFERQRIVSNFSHSDSHDKDLWKSKKVPQLVKTVCQ